MLVVAILILLLIPLWNRTKTVQEPQVPIPHKTASVEFHRVQVTHIPVPRRIVTDTDQRRRDFEVWKENNRRLFG